MISPVKREALERGLAVEQPEGFRSAESLARLAGYRPDVIVVCAYGQILTPAVLDVPPRQCLNVHFSLLPRHRGAAPVAAAILAGDKFTGVSVQLVRPQLDTGPLLISGAVTVASKDTTGSLTGRLAVVGAGLLLEALNGWYRGEITPRPQNEADATYFPQIKKGEGEIDWALSAADIGRRVRAYYPWPGGFTRWQGKTLKIIEAETMPGEAKVEVGKVIELPGPEGGLGVGTGAGILLLHRVQLEGKREMSAEEFLRGQRGFIGSVLPG